MTFVHSIDRKHFLRNLSVAFAIPIVACLLWMVMLYNQMVNLEHALGAEAERLREVQSQNAEFKETLFGLFESGRLEEFAATRNLVKEKNPHYLRIGETWQFASQY